MPSQPHTWLFPRMAAVVHRGGFEVYSNLETFLAKSAFSKVG
ncbi:hypothetical protein [Ktedonobacter sp. SOSP1-85]|nr:hypothetical protein [Ktedonobacter sp. SOSP1-85]